MTTPTSVVANLRGTLAQRRADRAERRQLERELASFTTADDQLELRAMLDRHTSDEGAEVRQILDRQATTQQLLIYPGFNRVA